MAIRHLYVHIPFCRSRCSYCDFASESLDANGNPSLIDAYLARLRAELAAVRASLELPLNTVYVGGGTPTILPRALLSGLVRELAGLQQTAAEVGSRERLGIDGPPDVVPEFTVEANPGTLDATLLEELREAGVTRLSVGVQSFSPRLREMLGRQVSEENLETCLDAIHEAGWREWNLDLIHGIPGQTWEESARDIDRAVEARPAHISLYDLTYTHSFSARVESLLGSGALDQSRSFSEENYSGVVARLVDAGYDRYEVSNYALPGHECRHNLAYWGGQDYVGIGASAVSTVAGERRSNPRTVADYIAGVDPEVESLDRRTRLWERAMLGLRTAEGVDENEVAAVIDEEAQERLIGQGCLERRCGKLRLNPGFLDLSNSVISALLASLDGP